MSAAERLRLRAAQGPVLAPARLAVLGAPGSHTERAARVAARLRGWRLELLRAPSVEGVLERLAAGECAYAVLPLHNTTSGPVRPAVEGLARAGLPILCRLRLRVHQALLVRDRDVTLAAVRSVASHPHALAQCRPFLRRRLPDRGLRPVGDTASAAHALAAGELPPNTAVLASSRAARLLGLHVLVEDCLEGTSRTTFALVGGEER